MEDWELRWKVRVPPVSHVDKVLACTKMACWRRGGLDGRARKKKEHASLAICTATFHLLAAVWMASHPLARPKDSSSMEPSHNANFRRQRLWRRDTVVRQKAA